VIGLSIFAALFVIGAIGNALSKPAPAAKTTSAAPPSAAAPAASSSPAASPSSCKLKTTFDYIVRDRQPGLQASAQQLGNVNYSDCTPTLDDFAQTAGQAQGECTTIALASANPGYNADATPARPLRKVIDEAGPGC
jgi:hypothetical protein